MEHKQSPSKKKLISIQEEKLLRKVDYDTIARARAPKKRILDLEILQSSTSPRKPSQRVIVSIKPRIPVPIRTIYIAEKNRHHSKKGSEKSATRLAIGDHSSCTTHCTEDNSSTGSPDYSESKKQELNNQENIYILSDTERTRTELSSLPPKDNVYSAKLKTTEKCYRYAEPRIPLVNHKLYRKPEQVPAFTRDVATFVAASYPTEFINRPTITIVNNLHRRIDLLERKILRQEMVFRNLDPHVNQSTSDNESDINVIASTSSHERAGCSYIDQYSRIPETSAFQRYAQQPAPLSPSKATTIEKEHNSEQYGRDFTAYDGITARGRRQCASVPCKRDDIPKMAAERVHKIRHKLNPVRDYRLMDTVHYLAQGEFAPRDDGIKLTSSREAVLSDIIWEDVCRTHWPTARLGRRTAHPERCNTRGELQRLIDSLLRERVAHVERRRRRHYRIVKLNHRHESCRPLGKTGDIIVASHKNKQPADENDMRVSEHNAASAMISNRKWPEHSSQRGHRSHDRLLSPEPSDRRRARPDESTPGPSGAWPPTCCYRAASPTKPNHSHNPTCSYRKDKLTSSSSGSSGRPLNRSPRLVVKKDPTNKKYRSRDEPNLEHFILLPTLVIRTPSNVKRQKKFNELYHRILNVQINKDQDGPRAEDNPDKKEIGLNINLGLSNSGSHTDEK